MGQDSNVEQSAGAVVVLEAADALGGHINGAHRVPVKLIKRVSPAGEGQYSTVGIEGGDVLSVFLPAHEVAALLGWP